MGVWQKKAQKRAIQMIVSEEEAALLERGSSWVREREERLKLLFSKLCPNDISVDSVKELLQLIPRAYADGFKDGQRSPS